MRLGQVENLGILFDDQMMNDTHVKPRCIAGPAGQIAFSYKNDGVRLVDFESQS